MSMLYRLTISDFRKITASIKSAYDFDFSNFALTSIKHRFERHISESKYPDVDSFSEALCTDQAFYKNLLFKLSVPDTEMFRDPEVWQELKHTIFPALLKTEKPRIWIPGSNSGEEVISCLMVLEEIGALNKIEVLVSNSLDLNLERIKKGAIDARIFEISKANYERYEGKLKFSEYFVEKAGKFIMKPDLLAVPKYEVIDLGKSHVPTSINLCIYRNAMIYFNKTLQFEILDKVHKSLVHGGYLLIGVKESMEGFNVDKRFIELNTGEGIYKRSFM